VCKKKKKKKKKKKRQRERVGAERVGERCFPLVIVAL